MSFTKTVDDLIADALAYDNSAETQDTFSPDDIAGFLDAELRSAVVPLTVRLMEEFFVVAHTSQVGGSAGDRVKIQADAAGFRVRDVYLQPASSPTDTWLKASRVNPDQLPYLTTLGNGTNSWFIGRGPTYIIENNELVFSPSLSQAFTCKVRYFKAPNHLLPYNECTARISAMDAGTNTLTVTNWATGPSGTASSPWNTITGYNKTTFDFMEPSSPYNFKRSITTDNLLVDITALAVNEGASTIQVSADTFNSLSVGDYVATSGYFGLVQALPFEAYNLLALRASMRILKAQGDLQNLGVSAQLFNAAADDYAALLAPKVENYQAKVANYGGLVPSSWARTWSR